MTPRHLLAVELATLTVTLLWVGAVRGWSVAALGLLSFLGGACVGGGAVVAVGLRSRRP